MGRGKWHLEPDFYWASSETSISVSGKIFIVQCQWPLFKPILFVYFFLGTPQKNYFILSQKWSARVWRGHSNPFMWPSIHYGYSAFIWIFKFCYKTTFPQWLMFTWSWRSTKMAVKGGNHQALHQNNKFGSTYCLSFAFKGPIIHFLATLLQSLTRCDIQLLWLKEITSTVSKRVNVSCASFCTKTSTTNTVKMTKEAQCCCISYFVQERRETQKLFSCFHFQGE